MFHICIFSKMKIIYSKKKIQSIMIVISKDDMTVKPLLIPNMRLDNELTLSWSSADLLVNVIAALSLFSLSIYHIINIHPKTNTETT